MPYRKKGQRSKLLDLAKKSRARAQEKRATKKRLKDQVARNMAAGSKTPAQRAAARKKTTPTAPRKPVSRSAVPPSLPKHIKGKIPYHKALVAYAKENPVETALTALPVGGAAGLGLKALKAASPALKLGKVASKARSSLSKFFKGKPKPKPSTTTTPAKPSGRGPASGGKKPSGPGSRTARRNQRQTAQQKRRTQSQKDRTAARKKRETAAERRERLDSGGVRMGINRRDAGLARGRNTMRNRRRRN